MTQLLLSDGAERAELSYAVHHLAGTPLCKYLPHLVNSALGNNTEDWESPLSSSDVSEIDRLYSKLQAGKIPIVAQPHSGHGQNPNLTVPGPQYPIADIGRPLLNKLIRHRARAEHIPPKLKLIRASALFSSGHAERHYEPATGMLAQMMRLWRQLDPQTQSSTDWTTGGTHRSPKKASGFVTASALVLAEGGLWMTSAAHRARRYAEQHNEYSYIARERASKLLGRGFHKHLFAYRLLGTRQDPEGIAEVLVPQDADIMALYRRGNQRQPWKLHTIVPEVPTDAAILKVWSMADIANGVPGRSLPILTRPKNSPIKSPGITQKRTPS